MSSTDAPDALDASAQPSRAGPAGRRPGAAPGPTGPALVAALRGAGLDQPWEHQDRAADLAHCGQHVVIATGTASGKSLAYLLLALTAIRRDAGTGLGVRRPTALSLAPMKALAADQLARSRRWDCPACVPAPTTATPRRTSGAAALTTPKTLPRVSRTGTTMIATSGPPRGASSVPTAKVRWRIASSGQDESTPYWNDATSASLTVTDIGASGISVTGSWNTAAEATDATLDSDPVAAGIQPTTLNPRVPVLLDVQVCLAYSTGTQCTWSDAASKTSLMRVPHAFGSGFPTAEAGPGQVALFTGEFNTDTTDVAVPGYTGSISLSRSHSTYANSPSVPTDAVTGIFGPGWTASLEGSDAGLGGLQAVDSTRSDGTIAFVDTDGTALVFLAPGANPRRATAANLTAGTYTPVDPDTERSGTTLTVAGTGAAMTLTLTQDDGTKTVFSPSTAAQAPTATTAGLFSPTSVTEPGSAATSYTRDTAGRVTRILAPIPPGTVTATGRPVTCPDGPVAGLDKGCRAVRIGYANPATGAPWRLPTTQTTAAADGAGVDIAGQTIATTSTDYTAQVAGTGDGWALGSPTKVSTGAISTITGYDSAGRTIETRQPMATGSDAGTTRTVYYTADDSAADSRCDDKPEWAGLVCAYSIWLAPTTTVETSGTATRTTTTTDVAGRPTSTSTTSTIPGSTARPAVYTHYDPATGQVDYTGPADQTSSQGRTIPDAQKTTIYDDWSRPTTYRAENPAGGYDTTTTSYDTAGRVATVTDPKGTTTTTWDGTDALGNTERRGQPTKISITRAGPDGGTGTLDFTGAYDPDGALTVQKLPGGITQTTTYDQGGEPIALTYDGQVTPLTARLDANGDPVLDANGDPVYDTGIPTQGTWLAWSQDNDVTGRVRQEYTAAGSSFDPATSGATSLDQVVAPIGGAIAYDRGYTYDSAGRLVTVADRTATTTGTTLDPATAATSTAPCTVRSYTFDANGRRTQLVADQHPDGDCTSTPTSTTTTSYAYDSADRPTTADGGSGTYTYDAFGRQTLIPAADTPTPAGGDITLGYYDNDLARTITQATTSQGTTSPLTTTFTLDSGGRRSTATTTSGPTTTTLQRHYEPPRRVRRLTGQERQADRVKLDPPEQPSTLKPSSHPARRRRHHHRHPPHRHQHRPRHRHHCRRPRETARRRPRSCPLADMKTAH